MLTTTTALSSIADHWILHIIFIVAIADLISGFVHWLEDNYGQEDWPIIGASLITPNLLHHTSPRKFLNNTWWQSADYQVITSVVIALIALWGGWLSWELVVLLVLASNANEVHKWAHRTRIENGRLITWLQDKKIVQSLRHHAGHHRDFRNSHYCTITQWVNPIIDRIKFWRFLEFCILHSTGVSPRIDAACDATRDSKTAGMSVPVGYCGLELITPLTTDHWVLVKRENAHVQFR